MLQERHPLIAFRDCGHCQAVIYDEKTGEPFTHNGREQPRHDKALPPCRTKRGCLKGTPEEPKTLTPKNLEAVAYYRRKMAVGRIPDDPLSEEIVAVILAVDRRVERERLAEGIAGELAPLLLAMKG